MSKKLKCIHVENSIRIENDGKCRACCMQYGDWDVDYNVSSKSFDEIKNAPRRLEVIEAFEKGIKHPACNRCWQEEKAGFKSKRQRDNEKFYNEKIYDQNFQFPVLIDVSMGNACNIKCRTCGAFNSSFWAKEYKDLGYFQGSDSEYKEWLKTFNDAFDETSVFWTEFENSLGSVKHIDFYGGEPFLVKKQWEMLEHAIQKGYSKDIVVHYNTNGTIWDVSKEDILSKFRAVYIDFSIDGTEQSLNYIRYPANWNTVFNNFKNALDCSARYDNININVCVTISMLNVFYIPEIDSLFRQHTNNVYLNLVHDPYYYNIKNLPEKIKLHVKNKLESYSRDDYYTDKVIKFMYSQKTKDDSIFIEFCKKTKMHDDYRKQDFTKVFPEFYEIMQKEGYTI